MTSGRRPKADWIVRNFRPPEPWSPSDKRNYEPYQASDPCFEVWKKITAKPRTAFEFDKIAWDDVAAHSDDVDNSPVCDAAELHQAGHDEAARELLMEVLAVDLRCIDAHGHLGNLEFDSSPERAMLHYEIGGGIGELSLGPSFSGFLPWGMINNRPFLRCLHGLGLCEWRLRRLLEAEQIFERILRLNPNDNQGVRFCLPAVKQGVAWAPDDAFLANVKWPESGPEHILH
jgi:tetratricopeptide (TPR) repeat protein